MGQAKRDTFEQQSRVCQSVFNFAVLNIAVYLPGFRSKSRNKVHLRLGHDCYSDNNGRFQHPRRVNKSAATHQMEVKAQMDQKIEKTGTCKKENAEISSRYGLKKIYFVKCKLSFACSARSELDQHICDKLYEA